jgi:hypothetical protein
MFIMSVNSVTPKGVRPSVMARPKSPELPCAAEREAQTIAKSTQRPGQNKEQTRLIAQGIQKGIEQYKKQHKAKLRQQDKDRKKRLNQTASADSSEADDLLVQQQDDARFNSVGRVRMALPWILLALSWALFLGFWLLPR